MEGNSDMATEIGANSSSNDGSKMSNKRKQTPVNKDTTNNTTHSSCPYLDSIDRTALDFDLEQACSVTLQTGSHIYVCLVCGTYLRGRGVRTPAHTHSVQHGHYVYCHLTTGTFYCLPDDYEITGTDAYALQDIKRALHPVFDDTQPLGATLSRDLFGRLYRPGFVGLQNLQGTDHMNAALQALAHVLPLRDYFLLSDTTHNHHQIVSYHQPGGETAAAVTTAFADVVRKMWSPYRFRSHVDPHVLAHVARPKDRRDVGDFIAWLLHQLHLGTKVQKTKKTKSIVEQTFQGRIKVTTRETQRAQRPKRNADNDDDARYGSGGDDDDDEANAAGQHDHGRRHEPEEEPPTVVAETVAETTFFSLSVDIPEKPLFRDEEGGLVIPQEALLNALQKFDGKRFVDVRRKKNQVKAQRRRYQILSLPDHLILHLTRFRDDEKNPTIIVFPVKNLDLTPYVVGNVGETSSSLPTEDQIRAMNVGELKRCIERYGGILRRGAVVEKQDLVEAALDATSFKYDLVANISHDSPVEVGREDGVGKVDQLHEGTYKCNVKQGDRQWYEIQDLHVKEVMPQQIGVSESCLLIFARHRRRSSS